MHIKVTQTAFGQLQLNRSIEYGFVLRSMVFARQFLSMLRTVSFVRRNSPLLRIRRKKVLR